MANREQSKDAEPHEDGTGQRPDADPNYRGDGPGKVGLISDQQPGLVAPSGVNQRDHGAAGGTGRCANCTPAPAPH